MRLTETCLDKIRLIKEINESRGRDYHSEVADAMIGRNNFTAYIKRVYVIAFDKTPDFTFMLLK